MTKLSDDIMEDRLPDSVLDDLPDSIETNTAPSGGDHTEPQSTTTTGRLTQFSDSDDGEGDDETDRY